ncbi:neutral/alkaline non-lysosomal ceramidase N-terminal domain-containing protein [uncultured Kriegella sp.]|uniref:neutral/alkaline non-lysosomal ceramidase N-terminal domain-containing protein n=1 Tax=uncultured Kriegella sp. TaxID=1798910 RepID=UPI0030D7F17D|tara:strand:- start:190884 stop:192257 length:1374 start_codon:yes stop_codon:yes gene_type:complete
MGNRYLIVFSFFLIFNTTISFAYDLKDKLIDVGVARIDITPEKPVRLAGYSGRDIPFEKVHHKLWAKAMAFGSEKEGFSILLTVDLLGIPGEITEKVRFELGNAITLDPENLTICASHTHSGPQIGNIVSHFNKPLGPDELAEIAVYAIDLTDKLKKVALMAIQHIKPAYVSWGQGTVGFAVNRRTSINPKGVVDHSLPILKISDPNGAVRAVLFNYACHAVTLGPKNNVVHGDWAGEAQLQIEGNFPGAIAMVSIGCGADQNSDPRMNSKNPKMDLENAKNQGKEIADEVNRLIAGKLLKPLSKAPKVKMRSVDLTFADIPDPKKLAEDAKEIGRTSNYSLLLLSRMARSEAIPMGISYPIQVWNFGKDLAMIFLAGEVVVDYSLRLKKELGVDRIWMNSYANDMPCYIPSLRVLNEGGYEADGAMIGYEKPARLTEDVEEIIMEGIYSILPKAYK